jgi:hypothetical protein
MEKEWESDVSSLLPPPHRALVLKNPQNVTSTGITWREKDNELECAPISAQQVAYFFFKSRCFIYP